MSEESKNLSGDVPKMLGSTLIAVEPDVQEAMKLIGAQPAAPEAPKAEGAAAPQAAAASTPEPVKEPPVATPAPAQVQAPIADSPQAKSWATIKEAEKKLVDERAQIGKERAEFEKQRADIAKQRAEAEAFAKKVKENPLEALADQGVGVETIMKQVLATPDEQLAAMGQRKAPVEAPKVPPAEQMPLTRAEFAAWQQQVQQQQIVSSYKGELKQELAKPEYDLLRAYPKAEQEMFDLAVLHAQNTGGKEVLTPAQVASRIQDEFRDYLSSLSSHSAIRQAIGLAGAPEKQAPAAPAVVPAPVAQPAANQSGSRAVTNNMAASPAPSTKSWDEMSETEQFQAALKLVPTNAWEKAG